MNQQIVQALKDQPEWKITEERLEREWIFRDFAAAMQFVERVAFIAEEMNHHPDIWIRYNRVQLLLTTHDTGGITALDVAFATRLNQKLMHSAGDESV